jgi:hypothetical protein
VKITRNADSFLINATDYMISYDPVRPMYLNLKFNNGLGAELFIPSGCDRDEMIDEIVMLGEPVIEEQNSLVAVSFAGETTLWKKAVYTFKCFEDKVLYSYKVMGSGKLDNARFFEGFLKDDPRMDKKYYPLFCGWGRHVAWHRPLKSFMQSSDPSFHTVYSSGINSADIRYFSYHESTMIRINSGRVYLGGDWLVTPPPFLYVLGNKERTQWLTMGLIEKSGNCNFMDFQYNGGERFGLNINYDGYTTVNGSWQSPSILFQMCEDVYDGTSKHTDYLRSNNMVKKNRYRNSVPRWWKEPIFGGWGEQMFHARHWEDYYQGQATGYSSFGAKLCTRVAYEKMLKQLEENGVDPTILIVDNRWFEEDSQLNVDDELWPDMKSFIQQQHQKGRKVILWVSPFAYCQSKAGKDVPQEEHMILNEEENYVLEIDTDVFYPACRLAKKKVRKKPHFEAQEKKEHVLWHMVLDVLNPDYEKRVRAKINYLLSPEGLDADGFEFDYTHFLPINRGMHPVRTRNEEIWGVEYLHKLMWIYYDEAKKTKSDALIIAHTFNPHFDDVMDMLRLQDIYTDNRSVVDQMNHRAKIAKIVAPNCVIHTDQHPMPSLEAWAEYAEFQPQIGNPCLYYVSGIETTKERFREQDWEMLRRTWGEYDAKLTEEYGPKEIPGKSLNQIGNSGKNQKTYASSVS